MATNFDVKGVNSMGIKLKTNEGEDYYIKSFKNGIVSISSFYGSLENLCEFVAGCFEEGSTLYGVTAVKFSYNGVKVIINGKNSAEEIQKLWLEAFKANSVNS